MDAPKILITGATGYIGGSVLTHLLNTPNPALKNASYTVLLRDPSKTALFKDLSVQTIIASDDSELRKIAADFDIILNAAYATSPAPTTALVQGLGDRLKEHPNGPIPRILQVSGTSVLSDRPHTNPTLFTDLGLPASPASFTDTDQSSMIKTLRTLEAKEEYAQRTATLVALSTAASVGVKATVIMSPNIFGPGSGVGNKASIQIPLLIKAVKRNGYAAVVGEGKEGWDSISINDLSTLYEAILGRIVSGEGVGEGEGGVLFTTTTRWSWRELLSTIVDAGVKSGYLKEKVEVKEKSLEDFVGWLGMPAAAMGFVELGFGSNAKTRGEVVRGWGWNGDEKLEEGVGEDWGMVAGGEGW